MQKVAALFVYDTTIYNEQATDLFSTVLAFLVLIGVVIDPTTQGANDSNQAFEYNKPRDVLKEDK